MTQNTEQNVQQMRDAQVDALFHGHNLYSTITQNRFRYELVKAEARGAEEQRRKDADGYLFDNPDTGTEYLPYHPIESGECQDAENIREATSAELLSELQNAWTSWKEDRDEKEKVSANVPALEARIAELVEAEQLARADAEASKANAGWNFLTENVSSDPELPSCRLNRMFQEGDSSERIEETLAAFGIEALWDASEWDWQAPPEEMEELSANDLKKCDPRKDLTDAGWKLVDAWDTEDGEIVRMYARPISDALTREGGV